MLNTFKRQRSAVGALFKRRGRTAAAVLVSAAATALFVLPASPASAVSFTNACANSVTPNNVQVDVDLTGTAPATVPPDGSFTLSDIDQTVFLPGSIFVTGYNLGLIDDGQTVPGTVRTVIEGTNTVEGTQTTPDSNVSVGPIDITDPDGEPGTGDETAAPAEVPASYPDQTWTAASTGVISFREDTVNPVNAGGSGTGGMVVSASIGPLTVRFACSPGTVAGSDPGVITYDDPADSFATTLIEGSPPPDNSFSFGKPKLNKNKGTAKLPVEVPGEGDVVLVETPKVKPDGAQANEAETVKLDIVAQGKAKKRLRKRGKATVTAVVTYTPTDGEPNTKEKEIRLVKR